MAQTYQGRFIQDGLSIDHTPGADVSAGDVVVQENLVGVAKLDIEPNAQGALSIGGVFDMVKAQEAFATLGANVFWDADGDPYNGSAGTGCLTATPTSNTWAGLVLVAAEATDETVRILLRSTVSLVAEDLSLADLSDIGALAYTAGRLLVADGDSFEDQALTGPFNLDAAGLLSVDSATVAAAGSVQGDAGAIADGFTLVSAADGTKGVVLPAAAAGGLCIVKNNAASVLKVWPNTSDAIDALGGDNAMSVAAYAWRVFVAYDATTWHSSIIGTAEIVGAMIAAESIDSDHFVDGGVDREHLEADAIDGTLIEDDAVDSEHILAGAVDASHLASWKEGNVAVAGDSLAIPVTHRHVSKTTGGDAEALTLIDGTPGQLLTIDLTVDGGGDGTLTPTTMTGFATIVFEDAGDQVTLQYIDDSVGWVIVGAAGVAAPPVITI